MLAELEDWKSKGDFISYGPFRHQLFVIEFGAKSASSEKTLLLLHGFPESSYSYHAVIDGLLRFFDRIILFDMLGYGFSDKPLEGYTYSLFEQADTVFQIWQQLGVHGGHLLAHDMGDSVATEVLARSESDLLPAWFSDGLQSITFTNGSMVLDLADLRVTQKLLLSRFGHLMKNMTTFKLFEQQVRSAHGNSKLSDHDIQILWASNQIQNGRQKTYLTIQYLNDRKRFEKTRWLPALSQTKLPIHICWGSDDAVANVKMAYYLKEHICKDATLTIMKGLGHFCQLASPDIWLKHISAFYK